MTYETSAAGTGDASSEGSASDGRPVGRLRVSTFLAPGLLPTYEAIADAVGTSLGMTTEIAAELDYTSCLEDLHDVCFVCSLPFVIHERQGLAAAIPVAAPVLVGERYRGLPIYFSDVIVHRDTPARSFLDLRGASWAYNEPMSQSGYGVTRHHLVSIGETDGFFGDVVAAGFHQTAIEMVRERTVDASAIDSHVLELAFDHDPSLADDVRVIDTLGPSTIQPIAVTKRFDPDLRDAIRDILITIHQRPTLRPLLARARIDRLVAVGPEDYADVRRMLDECERVGFTELR